jgi:HTH-type transcriptional regulator/antitoxin HigA
MQEMTTFAWLCRIKDEAQDLAAPSFDGAKLTSKTISHLVRLSKSDSGPRDAIDFLKKLGIRVVIESSLPGMRTDGASFVLKNIGPVIGLTLRYDRLDSFWFTLLHEIAHIILHLRSNSEAVFVDSIEDEDADPTESEIEAEADAFAKDSFVPRDAWLRSDAFRLGTEMAILALAKKCDIHPAIVAGRLRFERKRFEAFSQLLGVGQVRGLLMVG